MPLKTFTLQFLSAQEIRSPIRGTRFILRRPIRAKCSPKLALENKPRLNEIERSSVVAKNAPQNFHIVISFSTIHYKSYSRNAIYSANTDPCKMFAKACSTKQVKVERNRTEFSDRQKCPSKLSHCNFFQHNKLEVLFEERDLFCEDRSVQNVRQSLLYKTS